MCHAVEMSNEERRKIPAAALLLGCGGLLPFLATPIALGTGRIEGELVFNAFGAYSAVILSFLGGIRWGQGVGLNKSRARELTISVAPSLWAWISILIPSPGLSTIMLMIGFGTMGFLDRYYPSPASPAWMSNLRTLLSIIVVGCHGAVAGFVWF